jgi:DNA-binding IclR family transcriptional regulator
MDVKHNDAESRPGAPALEKGLDLLEALAAVPAGLGQKALAQRIGRSVGEVFRMLGVLERRGYIVRDERTGEYALTLRLFELAHRHPPTRRLQARALPIMEELARTLAQSCHLAVLNTQHMLVVAQTEPPDRQMGWSVRLGAVFPLSEHYVSVRVLAAFQSRARRTELVRVMSAREDASPEATLETRLERIAAAGHELAPSERTLGITDISFPVLDHRGQAIAALTVPFMAEAGVSCTEQMLLGTIGDAARRISEMVGGSVVSGATERP